MHEQKKVVTPKELENYEEYLSVFFPKLTHDYQNVPTTPEEIGIKMAKETLTHIQNLLLEIKKG